MLDNLYENIGGKIKNWAKWVFIIEAIGAVITGIALLATDDDLILAGLLTLFCGPLVAYVGSWILYAFGQLVDDIHALRNKSCPPEEENFAPKKNTYHTSKNIHCDFCLRKTGNIKTYKKVDKGGEILEFCLCEECAKNNGYL